MNSTELDECFEFAHQLVLKCGELLKEGFKNTGKVSTKTAVYDLVTFWDGQIERVLMNGIKEKYPDHKFIAEEDSSEFGTKDLTNEPTWIIDPIDGTINFVRKLNSVCISVALVIGKELKIAFLFNPTADELYTAKKGQGAFLNGEKIEASKQTTRARSLIAHEISLGSVGRFTKKYIALAEALLPTTMGIRSFGSAALTLGYVAKGSIDAYTIEYLKPWDIAAGALIIQEAGGIVMDVKGGPYDIMNPNVIVAGTQSLADEIQGILADVNKKLELNENMPDQM